MVRSDNRYNEICTYLHMLICTIYINAFSSTKNFIYAQKINYLKKIATTCKGEENNSNALPNALSGPSVSVERLVGMGGGYQQTKHKSRKDELPNSSRKK